VTELISFTVVCLVGCFGFATKTVPITHQCAQLHLHNVKDFSVSHSAPPVSRIAVHKEFGVDTARTADRNRPKGYPTVYHVLLSNKSWGKKEESGCSEFCLLSFQVTVICDGALLSCRWLNTCLPMEAVNELFMLLCLFR